MTRPLFSVIIPVFNAERHLPATLASLTAQTLPDWEALIIDDGSHDGSRAVIDAACAADPRMRLFHDAAQARPRGPSAARNIGLDHARGDYVAFLDADDLWLPPKLARQAEAFAQGAQIVFTAYRRRDHTGRDLGAVRAPARVSWRDALYGNPICCSTAAFRRDRFAGLRMPERDLHEDYAFWLSLLKTGDLAIGLPDILAEYTVRPDSRSANKLRSARAVWQNLEEQNIGFHRSVLCFAGYTAKSLQRRLRLPNLRGPQ